MALGLVPRRRLQWIPPEQRLAHEYCYFLHDQCVQVLVEYEKAKAHLVNFNFRNASEAAQFEAIANVEDSVTALRKLGRLEEARRAVINTTILGMVSDCM